MRTYDTLIKWFVLWIIFIVVCITVPQFFIPEIGRNQEFLVIILFLILIGICTLLLYLATLKRQRKQIHISLQTLQETGMQVFMKKYERLLYSRDIGDLPQILRLLFNFNCLAVLQPKTIEELQSIISLCEQYKIPLIARGSGTSGYGGLVPVKNGIIVNLQYFDSIINIDEESNTVEVECGVIWEHLRLSLESRNLTLLSYPSSAPSSSVGGWVAQGGYGVGSAKYGDVSKSVVSVTILGANGREFKFDNPTTFIGSCGSLGILWKVTLRVQKLLKLMHIAVSSTSQKNLLTAFSEYQDLGPFFLRYDDHQNLLWKNANQDESAWESQDYSGGIISMSFQEGDWEKPKIDEVTNRHSLTNLSKTNSEKFWNERFYTIKSKRLGPSLIIAEVLIPTNQLENFIEVLSNRYRSESFALELISTSDDMAIVFVWFPADLRQKSIPLIGSIPYAFHWLRFFDIIQIARNWKGSPYSSGLWLSPYSGIIYGKQLSLMKQLKKTIDPDGIFNPGKVWGTRVPRFFPYIPWSFLIRGGAPFVSILFRILPKKYR
ncbi:MAG: FAD-binding oxidoreductase [Candidatus Heimdallarchaeota archaeon]|nr:MAG: FAD-binding oxidoreductase [Candidatus Heimdallarchaeota archaeon]